MSKKRIVSAALATIMFLIIAATAGCVSISTPNGYAADHNTEKELPLTDVLTDALYYDDVKTAFWLEKAPDDKTVETMLWDFDTTDIEGETILSVSPSGEYILTANRYSPDSTGSFSPSVSNDLGLSS